MNPHKSQLWNLSVHVTNKTFPLTAHLAKVTSLSSVKCGAAQRKQTKLHQIVLSHKTPQAHLRLGTGSTPCRLVQEEKTPAKIFLTMSPKVTKQEGQWPRRREWLLTPVFSTNH